MSETNYWNEFYKSWGFKIPSQFAALVASEYLTPGDLVIDLGCGNGRDTTFFHNHGFKIFASDRSVVAIEKLQNAFGDSNGTPIFQVVDYSDREAFRSYLRGTTQDLGPRLFYARFLLHSLEPDALGIFIESIIQETTTGDRIALEFRTEKDDRLSGKIDVKHYRKGVGSHEILRYFASSRFNLLLKSEGFGYAIHKSDDAHVARIIVSVGDPEENKLSSRISKPSL